MSITTNLEAAYNLNDLTDSWTNLLNLSSTGSPSFAGGGMALDGATQYATHVDNSHLRGGDRSYGIFVRFKIAAGADTTKSMPLVSKDGEYQLVLNTNLDGTWGATLGVFRVTTAFEQVVVGGGTYSPNVTYDVSVWYDFPSTNLKIQNIDNCAAGVTTASLGAAGTNGTNANPFQIGHGANGGFFNPVFYSNFFNGTVYTVMFWSRTLDASGDCSTLYNGGDGYEVPTQGVGGGGGGNVLCVGAKSQLWALTQTTRKITRVQPAATRDMLVGTDLTTGVAKPNWRFSTGFDRPGKFSKVKQVLADVTGRDVDIFPSKSMDDADERRISVPIGETITEGAGDMASSKWRIRVGGEPESIVRVLMWDRDPLDRVR